MEIELGDLEFKTKNKKESEHWNFLLEKCESK